MAKTSLKRASSWQPTVKSAKGSGKKPARPIQAKSENSSAESQDLQGYREQQPSALVENVKAAPLGGMGASFPSNLGGNGNELIAPRSSLLGSMTIQAKTIGEPNQVQDSGADRVARRLDEQVKASAPIQCHAEENQRQSISSRSATRSLGEATNNLTSAQRPNNTGLPDRLKTGIENLSGYSMDEVKVHYNSSKPAQLQAHAYAQGKDIHLAPGQEKHLPHEAWHVVQQMQERVQPTIQAKGLAINDDPALEREADLMGEKAFNLNNNTNQPQEECLNENQIQSVAHGKTRMPNVGESAFQKIDNRPEDVKQRKRQGIGISRQRAEQCIENDGPVQLNRFEDWEKKSLEKHEKDPQEGHLKEMSRGLPESSGSSWAKTIDKIKKANKQPGQIEDEYIRELFYGRVGDELFEGEKKKYFLSKRYIGNDYAEVGYIRIYNDLKASLIEKFKGWTDPQTDQKFDEQKSTRIVNDLLLKNSGDERSEQLAYYFRYNVLHAAVTKMEVKSTSDTKGVRMVDALALALYSAAYYVQTNQQARHLYNPLAKEMQHEAALTLNVRATMALGKLAENQKGQKGFSSNISENDVPVKMRDEVGKSNWVRRDAGYVAPSTTEMFKAPVGEGHKEGEYITENALMSTTTKMGGAGFNPRYTCYIKANDQFQRYSASIAALSAYPQEEEVLAQPGIAMRILTIYRPGSGERTILYLEPVQRKAEQTH